MDDHLQARGPRQGSTRKEAYRRFPPTSGNYLLYGYGYGYDYDYYDKRTIYRDVTYICINDENEQRRYHV